MSYFINLDKFINKESLTSLDLYLRNQNLKEFYCEEFTACSKKHGNKIQLTKRTKDVSNLRERRLSLINPNIWEKTENWVKLKQLSNFIEELPFFEFITRVVIILNQPNINGVEHSDHPFNDLVSEFVWIRTNQKKKFYIRNKQTNEKTYVNCNCIWFDDHLKHNISPINDWSFSIRIDGKFKDEYRQYIAENGIFKKKEYAKVLLNQKSFKNN